MAKGVKKYELRLKTSKFNYNIIGTYENPALAYGMRKKYIQENPELHLKNKLYVKIFN